MNEQEIKCHTRFCCNGWAEQEESAVAARCLCRLMMCQGSYYSNDSIFLLLHVSIVHAVHRT